MAAQTVARPGVPGVRRVVILLLINADFNTLALGDQSQFPVRGTVQCAPAPAARCERQFWSVL